MTVKFIIPCYNANANIPNLINSLFRQNDDDWDAVFIDDMSDEHILVPVEPKYDNKISVVVNVEKKYALRNIVEAVQQYSNPEDIIAVIDGDDELCNDNAVSLLKGAYSKGCDVVWTAHKWDINGANISKPMPDNVDPYAYPWCSSHLRTFRASLLNKICIDNFKDHKGNWFQRGYDQALMLPLLKISKKYQYIDEVCYLYKINSVSVNDRDWAEKKQLSTINFIRARGFIS